MFQGPRRSQLGMKPLYSAVTPSVFTVCTHVTTSINTSQTHATGSNKMGSLSLEMLDMERQWISNNWWPFTRSVGYYKMGGLIAEASDIASHIDFSGVGCCKMDGLPERLR